MYIGLHVGCPLFLLFLQKLNFLHRFSKNSQISNFIEIFSLGDELAHEDGRTARQTDRHMTKLIIAVRNFSNAPKTQEWNLTTVTLLIKYHSKIKQRSLTG